MGSEILITVMVWLTIGIVIGGWISIDTFRKKVNGTVWVVAGVLLSVIGLAIYLIMRDKIVNKSSKRDVPEYRYSEPATPAVRRPPMEDKIVEPTPAVPTITKEPDLPHPESPLPQGPVHQAPETTLPEYRSSEPEVKVTVEGVPRCKECGADVSMSSGFCSECGARLK
jgi:hypothetical protein